MKFTSVCKCGRIFESRGALGTVSKYDCTRLRYNILGGSRVRERCLVKPTEPHVICKEECEERGLDNVGAS